MLLRLPNHLLHRSKAGLFSFVFVAAALTFGETPGVPHVRNFGQVDRTVYRGAQPSAIALQELQAQGVKIIIDLREAGENTTSEREEAKQLGMQYVNVPLAPFSAPAPDQVRTVLWLLTNHGDQSVFVHCRRGKDRTGTMIACYRVQHDGWNNAKALEEAKEYGMSRTERSMRSFILHFTPLSAAALLPQNALKLPVQP